MIKALVVRCYLFASAIAAGQIVGNDGANARWVDLHKTGEVRVEASAGKHRADVRIVVTKLLPHLPSAMMIGPSPTAGAPVAGGPTRIISAVQIRVDGCMIDQPVPAIAGFTDPSNANLQFIEGHWQLSISGSDGADGYGAIYAFNNRRVFARALSWGTFYSEKTNYDISVDPDVMPRNCSPRPR